MKKKTKKLVLAKETVRDLETSKLEEVQGGLMMSDGGTCYTDCGGGCVH